MTTNDYMKHLEEVWANVLTKRSVLMAFAVALKAEAEGDAEKADLYLDKAIVAEANGAKA